MNRIVAVALTGGFIALFSLFLLSMLPLHREAGLELSIGNRVQAAGYASVTDVPQIEQTDLLTRARRDAYRSSWVRVLFMWVPVGFVLLSTLIRILFQPPRFNLNRLFLLHGALFLLTAVTPWVEKYALSAQSGHGGYGSLLVVGGVVVLCDTLALIDRWAGTDSGSNRSRIFPILLPSLLLALVYVGQNLYGGNAEGIQWLNLAPINLDLDRIDAALHGEFPPGVSEVRGTMHRLPNKHHIFVIRGKVSGRWSKDQGPTHVIGTLYGSDGSILGRRRVPVGMLLSDNELAKLSPSQWNEMTKVFQWDAATNKEEFMVPFIYSPMEIDCYHLTVVPDRLLTPTASVTDQLIGKAILQEGLLRQAFTGTQPTRNRSPGDLTSTPLEWDGIDIAGAQQQLNALGFDAGTTDGVAGIGTRAALKAFQKSREIEATGIPNKVTMDELYALFPPTIAEPADRTGQAQPSPSLWQNVDVARLQRTLNDLGFQAGAADGVPGKGTRSALKAFQKSAGLPGTGQPDEHSLQRLFSSRHGR